MARGKSSSPRQHPAGHCHLKPQSVPALPPDLEPGRASAIRRIAGKWLNGTVLHYYFIGGPPKQQQAVRDAFATWKALPIGLEFVEVTDRSEAEIRISFENDGSWSYVGKDVLGIPENQATMNFGWDLTDDYGRDTALHEIGHTLGMPHEHQNPFAGIEWDEEAVYESFGNPPNNWSRQQTFHNVLRKLDPASVEGSKWDPDSVMEYWFGPGLIREPAKYAAGLEPAGGLSATDKKWAKQWFPAQRATLPTLKPFESKVLQLSEGQQVDYRLEVDATRRHHFSTFGFADTVLALFEEVDGDLRFVAGDDDSGIAMNAQLSEKLFKGRSYVLRLRLYWKGSSAKTGLMYW